MATREILTIQLGNYSNYVGTHWWNLQETNFDYEKPSEINPDVLYREGMLNTNSKTTTFTPRLLLADLKGTFGYLNTEGSLYGSSQFEEPNVLWDNPVEPIKEESESKSTFVQYLENNEQLNDQCDYNLDNENTKWVDYLIPRFHPRTVNVITEYEHQSEDKPFNLFPYGESLWKTQKFSEQFADNMRLYVEECNSMQGFQILMDCNDGYSGLGSACIEYIKDEYDKKSILTFPVIEPKSTDRSVADLIKIVNMILCWHKIGENSSLFSPLSCGKIGWPNPAEPRTFDFLSYKSNLKYHTSALLATALDTISIQYRNKKSVSTLSDLCADLNQFNRKAAATSLSLPFPMVSNKDFIDVLDDFEGTLWTSLTPNCEILNDYSMQRISLRGIPENRLKRPVYEAKEQMKKAAYRCSNINEMMNFYLSTISHATASHITTIEDSLKIKAPYPNIFNSDVQENGNISEKGSSEVIKSTPVMAGLHTGAYIAKMYESLHEEAQKIKSLNRFHAFKACGLEKDEYAESLNNLLDCKEAYEDHYF